MTSLLGVAEWCLDQRGLEAVARAAALGFGALHFGISSARDEITLACPAWRRELSLEAQHHDIAVTCIAINRVEHLGLTRSSGSSATERCLGIFSNALLLAEELKAPLVYVPSFGCSEIRSRRDLRETVDFLRTACRMATGTHVLIASENTLDAHWNKVLLEAVDTENIRVLLDIYNPVRWGHDTVDIINTLSASLAPQIHVKDGSNGILGNMPLGTGVGNTRVIAAALNAASFWDTLILENDYAIDTERRIAQDISAVKSLFTRVSR